MLASGADQSQSGIRVGEVHLSAGRWTFRIAVARALLRDGPTALSRSRCTEYSVKRPFRVVRATTGSSDSAIRSNGHGIVSLPELPIARLRCGGSRSIWFG